MLRLTDRAVQALRGAEQLAWQCGQPRVEPTHLLQALLARPDSMACRVLAGLGVDPQAAARALQTRAPGRGPDAEIPGEQTEPAAEPAVGRLPFSQAAKGVVERAAEEAQALGHRYLGTEHLLLALLAAGGETGQTLRHLGADLLRARQALQALLPSSLAGPPPHEPTGPSGPPGATGASEPPGGSGSPGGTGGPKDGPAV